MSGSLAPGLALAAVLEVRLPTGTDGFGPPEAVPTAEFVVDYTPSELIELTANAVAIANASVDTTTMTTVRYAAVAGSLALTVKPLRHLSLFVQGVFGGDERSDAYAAVGGGIVYQLAERIQIDTAFVSRVTTGGPPPTLRVGTTFLY